jgi:hypothetical protein
MGAMRGSILLGLSNKKKEKRKKKTRDAHN